jgi:hypothetical protein
MSSISDRSRTRAIWPCLLVLAGALLPLQPTIADEAAFHDGHADRQGWEAWFAELSGAYREGAEFWAGHRSDHKPPDCAATQMSPSGRAAKKPKTGSERAIVGAIPKRITRQDGTARSIQAAEPRL